MVGISCRRACRGWLQVKLWDLRRNEPIGSFDAHSYPVMKLAFSPDDNTLVSCGADGTLAFWRL